MCICQVYVDAHVLSTPGFADINNDGIPELFITVTYYFDENEYVSNPSLFNNIGYDVNIHMYVAGKSALIALITLITLYITHTLKRTIQQNTHLFYNLYENNTVYIYREMGCMYICVVLSCVSYMCVENRSTCR